MASPENNGEKKEIIKINQNTELEPNQKESEQNQNQNIPIEKEEENINKTNSDIELNITTYPLKLVFLGNSNVGKTSIIQRFIEDKFEQNKIATNSLAYSNKKIKTDPFTELKMYIWDTAGQERFRSLTRGYLRESDGIFLVFDLSDKQSFDDITFWLNEVNSSDVDKKMCVIMLVGNKLDSEKKVIDKETANKYAEENKMKYLEVSAKDGINIFSMFEIMGDSCVKKIQEEINNDSNSNKISIKKRQKSDSNDGENQIKEKQEIEKINKKQMKDKKDVKCC